MKVISILAIVLLTACAVWQKDEAEIKKIGHDVVDEGVDSAAK